MLKPFAPDAYEENTLTVTTRGCIKRQSIYENSPSNCPSSWLNKLDFYKIGNTFVTILLTISNILKKKL